MKVRVREREKDLLSTGSPPKGLSWLGLDKANVKSHMGDRAQVAGSSSIAFAATIAGCWIESRALRIKINRLIWDASTYGSGLM